jgi:secondary thiamine-phosphate synthase enzyme
MERALTEAATRRRQEASASGQALGVVCHALEIDTAHAPQFIDITDEVIDIVRGSGVRFGQVTVFSAHTTAAIKLNEHEPLLLDDMCRMLEQVAPSNGTYDHNDFSRRTVNMEEDECENGHAHCQHLFLGTSETVPILSGELTLGQWQRIFLIELDRPRARRVLVNVVGVA